MRFPFKPPVRDPEALERATATFDLYETALTIQEGNLRRRFPRASDEEIAERLRNWVVYRTENGESPEAA